MLIYHVSVSHTNDNLCLSYAIESRRVVCVRMQRKKQQQQKLYEFLLDLFLYCISHTVNNGNWFNSSVHLCCIRVNVFENRYTVAASKRIGFRVLLSLEVNLVVFSLEFCVFFFRLFYTRSTNDYVTDANARVWSYPHCNAFECSLWCHCCFC